MYTLRTRMHFQRNNKTLLYYSLGIRTYGGGVCHKFDRVRYILVKGSKVSVLQITAAEVDKFYDWVSLVTEQKKN